MRFLRCALLGALSLLALPAPAQTPGTCAPATAVAYLDVGNVRARILGDGRLFWPGGGPQVYEVPKGGGRHALFTASLLVGGRIDGEVRTAAERYSGHEFWPGPYDPTLGPPTDCARYDRLWSIYRADLERYDATGEATDDLLDWPHHLGAPVVDGDGDPTNYDLAAGDRPELVGDQMIWWVMNDVGGPHLETESAPIGLEVHGTAFAYHRPRSYVNDLTFYRYVLINRNDRPLDSTYVGLFVDPDLGNFFDDYVGSDSTLHLGFAYNADNDDDEHNGGYGEAPPAIGLAFLRTASAPDGRDNDHDGTTDEPGEQHGMAHFLWYYGGTCVKCEPLTAADYYAYLRARWKDGSPLTLGGDGYQTSDTAVNFSYPGDPVSGAFWSERNIDDQGTANQTYDRNFIASTGPFTLAPGARQEITVAFVWARGTDHLDSVSRLRTLTAHLRRGADALLQPMPVATEAAAPAPRPVLGFAPGFPNPFTAETTIRYSLPRPMKVRLAVYDVLGREVAVLAEGPQAAGIHTARLGGAGLPPGLYVARLQADHLAFAQTLVRVR